jgi:hypothetical protein
MTNTGINRITARYLNDVNDPLPGQSVTGGQTYVGQLGSVETLNAAQALALSSGTVAALTNVGTLYAGKYQYVQFYVSQSGTTIAGGPVYWQDADNFVVTADVPTGAPGFAGVAINVPTKGNYGWILVDGKCKCQPLDNTTKASPAIGDNLVLSTIGRFDDLADATAIDGTNFKLVAGQWIEAPADATSTLYLAYVKFACKNAS